VDFAGTNAAEIEDASRSRTNACNHPWVSQNLSTIAASWNFSFAGPRTVTIFKHVGIASSDAFANAQSLSFKTALNSKSTPWETLIEDHNDAWDSTWDDTGIEVPGNEELQITTRGSLFHLLANARPGTEPPGLGDNSIMVSGLSGDSYAGLIFWDSDTWMYPPLLTLFPEYAMSINNYRTRLLPMAIENAQSYGYAGLLFPWTSGRFGNCTGTGLCKDYQYHLDFDVAQSHWQYYLHTKDEKWLREKGWPVIKNTADMFANYVTKNKTTGRFETILMGEPVSILLPFAISPF
jgi:trehalose/maltose hydrolase-like predicted phosphorylase